MADESGDSKFRAEYAKSNRSSCKACKSSIAKAELRLAIMVQSPMFDGQVPNWHHVKCFFQRARPTNVAEIGHYESLRWEDQEKIEKLVKDCLAGKGPSGGKAVKASKTGTILNDFRVELAKSSGAACRVCEVKIKKNEPRVGKKELEDQRARMYGPYDRWHHVSCFAEKREEFGFFDAGEKLQGFMALGADDKELIRSSLKEIKGKRKTNGSDEPDAKKAKVNDEQKEEIKKQTKKLYYYRDMLERNLSKKQLEELLVFNGQDIPQGVDRMLDRLADGMMFGALERCKACGNGQLVFKSGTGYVCLGDMSEWTKCQEVSLEPKRKEFKLPKDYKTDFDFCKLYKSKVKARVMSNLATSFKSPTHANGGGSASSTAVNPKPLKNLTFVLEGKHLDKIKLTQSIEKLGGKVAKSVNRSTAAVISDEETVKKETRHIKSAKAFGIQVVTDDVLDDVETDGIFMRIKVKSIVDWGTEPRIRLAPLLEKQKEKAGGSGMFAKDMPKSMKVKLKGGAYVDPESGLEHKAHVYKSKDTLFSVVLGAVNISSGTNSYYKLQLLQHDKKPQKFYIFRSWGRVGTTIGGTKTETFDDKTEAMALFEQLYLDKSGNEWRHHKKFQKVPGKLYPLDLDMGEGNKEMQQLSVEKSTSKLDKAIQELISLIFDIDSMRKAMVEFEIDLTKMPLGKISRKQIESAYSILTEALNLIRSGDTNKTKFLDASNRFFTLIPHDFGMKAPPVLDNPDIIKTKIDMLDNLLEIEIAYNLLQSKDENDNVDPIDAHYIKLQTDMSVLDKKSDEFKILSKYVKNTHATTHNLYELEIEDIFKIERKGEKQRFAKFESLGNRMLLWHGSRTTNFAGILSQGLRIAPPEAPVTGYMFGKGIYFADMVSKSANYCCTSRTNNTGLLLLCDVALGDMYERNHADYIEKLPPGKNSTKGLGRTEPDPKSTKLLDSVQVPMGKGVPSKVDKTDLLYNEYIIYDVAQCQAKYLFRMKFNYKSVF